MSTDYYNEGNDAVVFTLTRLYGIRRARFWIFPHRQVRKNSLYFANVVTSVCNSHF